MIKKRRSNYQNVPIKIEAILDKRTFVIPSFQRKIVWTKSRREAFLRNLLVGDPFGVLLIRIRDDGKYELIDGLQRITTIQDFNNNPYKYLDSKDINQDLVDKLIEANLTVKNLPVTKEYIEENREKWQKKIFDTFKDSKHEPNLVDLLPNLTKDFDLSSEQEILRIVNDIVEDFKNFINLNDIEVYAINYIGKEENIPKVFDNLNTGGVKLSKYDTLSAKWFNKKFIVDDEDLIDIVVARYEQLEKKSGLEVDYDKEALMEDGITLHEYCRAIGIIMTSKEDEFDILFGRNDTIIEKVGFEVVSLLLTGKVNGTTEMNEKILENNVEGEFLVQLKDAIKESLVQIREALKHLLIGKNKSYLYSERIYLIYHIIVSYMKEYYDINLETGKVNKKEDTSLSKNRFKKFVELHYLYDCITDYWKENRQVSDLDKAVANKARRERYWYDIPIEDWNFAIDKFMTSQESVGKTVPQPNKLFIDFLTKLKINENRNYDKFFTEENISNKEYPLDIEHITAKKVIQDHINALDEEEEPLVPISAVGNLCYLTAKSNRGKKYFTLHETMEGRPEYFMNPDFQKCILYPTEEELKFKDYDKDRFFDEYNKFLDERQEKLKDEFLRLIKNYP